MIAAPTGWFAQFTKQLPLLALATAILVMVTVLGYLGDMAGVDVFRTVMGLSVAIGVLSIAMLTNPLVPNNSLVTHLAFTAELIAVVLVLRIHNVFTSDDVNLFIVAFIGTGLASGVSTTAQGSSTTAALESLGTSSALGTYVDPLPPPAAPGAPPAGAGAAAG